ncbi:MAG: hypothetical protein JNN07_21930 [Verrucomicrobiales bacterium]|nr:hypothetical protein [Verrucomicrobiales bacterium]
MKVDGRISALASLKEGARKDFQDSVHRLVNLVGSVNPLQLLAHFAYYDQLHLQDTKDGSNYTPASQSAVEWLQALTLRVSVSAVEHSMTTCPTPQQLAVANHSLNTAEESCALMRLPTGRPPESIEVASETIRHHTAFVRNEGYGSQLRRLHLQLFQPLDKGFKDLEGVSLSEVATFLWALLDSVERRVNDELMLRRKIVGQPTANRVIKAFATLIECPADEVRKEMGAFASDLRAVRAAVVDWLDSRNFRLFWFTESDLAQLLQPRVSSETVRSLLKTISLPFGALEGADPEKLLLDNPVWTKPLIDAGGDCYYCPFVGSVPSFGLEILEQLLHKHPELTNRYVQDVRPAYLEKQTEAVVRKAFPQAKIWRGLRWKGSDGRDYENDVLAMIDTHVLVFECKSGRVRPRAQRGDPAAMKTDLGKLIGDAAVQGRRFADFLLASKGVFQLQDATGRLHQIDLRQVIRTTSVNITLDYVGQLGVERRLLNESGLLAASTPIVPTIPLHDLENIFELLNEPAIASHYLNRRPEITSSNHILASENAMLALYLMTSFDFGEVEGDSGQRFVIPDLGQRLNPYFMAKERGINAPKPSPRLVQWWHDILAKFEQRKFPGWIEAAHVLLSVGYERQREFERLCKRVTKDVRNNWHQEHQNTCVMVIGPTFRRTAIVFLAIKMRSQEQVRELVQDRIERSVRENDVLRILVITYSAGERVYPYLGAYFHCPELQGMAASGLAQELSPSPPC